MGNRYSAPIGHSPATEIQEVSCAVRGAETLEDEEGETKMTNATAVKDPVCGMDIDAATAAGQTEHKGRTYYFCGSKCKEKFDLAPEQYLGKSAEAQKGGCCS